MASLDETAFKNPQWIENMIKKNKDGTYTVDFQVPVN